LAVQVQLDEEEAIYKECVCGVCYLKFLSKKEYRENEGSHFPTTTLVGAARPHWR